MIKQCQRCSKDFTCRNDLIMECDCVRVIIPPKVYQHIKENYTDCLCVECIEELKVEQQRSPKPSAALLI